MTQISYREATKSDIDHLPQIPESELTILWHCGYYDGPRSGVMRYQSKPWWFSICERADAFERYDDNGQQWIAWHQRFFLVELTASQFDELQWHNELFRRLVGTYWDYDAEGQRAGGQFHPKSSQQKFYSLTKHMKSVDLSQNRVIGWFEWVSHAEAEKQSTSSIFTERGTREAARSAPKRDVHRPR